MDCVSASVLPVVTACCLHKPTLVIDTQPVVWSNSPLACMRTSWKIGSRGGSGEAICGIGFIEAVPTMQGFRHYLSIRNTLCHELAHMVWSEHDNNFKELNSQLLKEVKALDWTQGAYAADAGAPQQRTSPGSVDPKDTMAVTAQASGKTLRALTGQAALATPLADPRAAAGQVCMHHALNVGDSALEASGPTLRTPWRVPFFFSPSLFSAIRWGVYLAAIHRDTVEVFLTFFTVLVACLLLPVVLALWELTWLLSGTVVSHLVALVQGAALLSTAARSSVILSQ